MGMMRTIAMIIVMIFLVLPVWVFAVNPDCANFSCREEAQKYLVEWDPSYLDADWDGIACELLPSCETIAVSDSINEKNVDTKILLWMIIGFIGIIIIFGWLPWYFFENSRAGYRNYTYNSLGFWRDKYGYDRNWYNVHWWNREWYDSYGYNSRGFKRPRPSEDTVHRNGTLYDDSWYDVEWYGKDWFKKDWYYDKWWYDREWYNKEGFNEDWYFKKTGTKYGADWYDYEWYNRHGFNKDWYDREGNHMSWRK